MAVTAAITAGTATPKTGQQVGMSLLCTNGGASAVNVVSCVPTCVVSGTTQTGSGVLLGQPNLGPGMTTSIAGSNGTLTISFSVVPIAPQVGNYNTNPFPSAGVGGVAITPLPPEAMPQSIAYDIGALLSFSDGTTASATAATITVAAVKAGV